MGNGKWYIQFSKILTLLFALCMLPLSWYVVDRGLTIAEMAIVSRYMGALPVCHGDRRIRPGVSYDRAGGVF